MGNAQRNIVATAKKLENELLHTLKYLDGIQKEVHDEYAQHKDFKSYQLFDMTAYVNVINILASRYSRTQFKVMYERCFDIWFNELHPQLPGYFFVYENCATMGKILAGLAFNSGNVYLGLRCLCSVLDLTPNDMFVFSLMGKYSLELKEFDIFRKYDSRLVNNDIGLLEAFRSFCYKYIRFFETSDDNEKEKILEDFDVLSKDIAAREKIWHSEMYIRQLIHCLFGEHSKSPNKLIEKFGDLCHNLKIASECSLSCCVLRRDNFFQSFEPIYLFNYNNVFDSDGFLADIMEVVDYCDTGTALCNALYGSGCTDEYESRFFLTFFIATKIGSPTRILQCLNQLYYYKLRTINDQNKLKGCAAMIALLLGRVHEDNNNVDDICEYRKILLNDKYVFRKKRVDDSVVPEAEISFIPTFPKHYDQCSCYLCYERRHNPAFYIEECYSKLLSSPYSVTAAKEFVTVLKHNGFSLTSHMQQDLYKTAFRYPRLTNNNYKFPVVNCICVGLSNFLIINKDIGDSDKIELCDAIIKCSELYPLKLRYFWLLARQMKRSHLVYQKYPWLLNPNENKPDDMEDSYKEMADEAEADFDNFGQLFYFEWRFRICQYLGAIWAFSSPWASAWYFCEGSAISLRQYNRINTKCQLDLRFYLPQYFFNCVNELPKAYTFIQLFIDESNYLWLVRLSCTHSPIVLPIKKIIPEDIPSRMLKILLENDHCCKSNDDDENDERNGIPVSDEWYQLRNSIDHDLAVLIEDIQARWFSSFKPLLLPFHFKPSSETFDTYLSVKKVITDAGITEHTSNFLAKLFFNSNQSDFEFLIHVVCFLEEESNYIQESLYLQNIYEKLKKICSDPLSHLTEDENDKFVFLSLSPDLSCYPLECLPCFNSDPLIHRIQSFHMLYRIFKTRNVDGSVLIVNSINSYFIINPDGTLKYMEASLLFQLDHNEVHEIHGKNLSSNEFGNLIRNVNFLFYCGHGNGTYSYIRSALCHAVTIFMGCSSVRIEDEGRGFDGRSAVNDYIIAGSPCVIGCLWQVTDSELNKFFEIFLSLCFAELCDYQKVIIQYKNSCYGHTMLPYRTLIRALHHARKECKLKYLTGASLVAYGIPIVNQESEFDRRFRNSKSIEDTQETSES